MTVTLRRNNMRSGTGRRSGMLISGLVLLALFTGSALFYAYATERSLQASYRISKALEMQRRLRETSRRLQVEINNLRSPQRLEQAALREGMIIPGPDRTRRAQ